MYRRGLIPPATNEIQSFGAALFGKINLFIFAAIWIFVPLATADAVSRERREGTLPLLYLTELRSPGIIVGKTFVHLLRAFTLFATVVPWLMLSLVFGGVEMGDVWMALMLDFSSVLLALAAGLLASTIPRDWLKSVMLAELFALILLLMLLWADGWVLSAAAQITFTGGGMISGSPPYILRPYGAGMLAHIGQLIEYATNGSFGDFHSWYGYDSSVPAWQELQARLSPGGLHFWRWGTVGLLCGAGLILLAAIRLAARRVESSWRDAPSTASASTMRQKFIAPRFQVRWLNQRLSRSLSANPVGWLHHYSPSARLVKWGWCLFVVLIEIILSTDSRDLYLAQVGVGLVLLLGLTFSATGSFRNELETGAFELLLVTPLRERQIIMGRVRGLWQQFLPAIVVYVAGSMYLVTGWKSGGYFPETMIALIRVLAGFCTLPVIGLYFSLKRWNFFAAWLAASLIGLAPGAVGRLFGIEESLMLIFQVALGAVAAKLLARQLRDREFLQAKSGI
jgi:ABC-type transport system involved in multi-copper enzyme maturation permease subunit